MRKKSDKLMNYCEHRGRQTKSKRHGLESLLHPICSQRIPPKIDSLLTQPDTLCERERKWEIKEQRMEDKGHHLPKVWAEAGHWTGSHTGYPSTFKLTTYLRPSNGNLSNSELTHVSSTSGVKSTSGMIFTCLCQIYHLKPHSDLISDLTML